MSELQIRALTPAFGAEVTSFDPTAALEDANTRRALQQLFDERGLVVLPDLEIDQLTQTNLARTLIGLPRIDELPEGRMGTDPVFVSNREQGGGAPYGRLLFHSDTMWSPDPIKVLSLYGVEVEQPATPTVFASTVHAWGTLPLELRTRMEGLHAVHGHDDAYPEREMDDPDVLRSSFELPMTTTTPIAHTHPRNDRKMLYVSQMATMRIDELPEDESEALLEELYEHAWQVHDLVAWDNLAVQHARPNLLLDGPARTLRKVFAPMPERIDPKAHPLFTKVN